MLADDTHRTGDNALSAIRALFLIDNVATSFIPIDGILWADLSAFSTLSTDKRTEFAWIGKFRFDPKCCFFRIDLEEVLDSADLQAKPAASAIVSIDFYPHIASLMFTSINSKSTALTQT
jgi:hypothetical protein